MKICAPFGRFKVEGESMIPALQPGNSVLVWRWGSVRAGDIVVFSKNGMTMVKRTVQKNADRLTVRGDNWQKSTDSADFGDVDMAAVVGKVVARY